MKRRDFVKGMGLAGGLATLQWRVALAEEAAPAEARGAKSRKGSSGGVGAVGDNDPGVAQKAWREFVDALRECDRSFIDGRRGSFDEYEMAYGYRNLTHIAAFAVDMYMEGDPNWPEFVRLDTPTKKLLGGNPDTQYHYAPVRGDRRYRITGRRGEEVYLSFTSHRGTERGQGTRQFFDDTLNHHRMKFEPDGRFEVIVSPKREGENWLRISPDATNLLSRTYVFDRIRDRPATFSIEPLDSTPPPPRLRREEVAERLRQMTQFVRETALVVTPQPLDNPNQLGKQFRYEGGSESDDWATVDNVYARGVFSLEPSETLVIEGVVVPCDYWGIQVWNPFVVSPDYRHHRVSINKSQAHLGSGGQFRVAIAQEDPGVPGLDWISTAGERQGTFFVRWLVSKAPPPMPTCKLMKLSELRA